MYPYKFSFLGSKNLSKIISEIEDELNNELNKEYEMKIQEDKIHQEPLVLFEDKGLLFPLKENIYLFSKISVIQ